MTPAQAARQQYLRKTSYTVVLAGPEGQRHELGTTDQHSGRGLLTISASVYAQKVIAQSMGDASEVTFVKRADRLQLSNGWAVIFGGTIRQEAK